MPSSEYYQLDAANKPTIRRTQVDPNSSLNGAVDKRINKIRNNFLF